MNKKKLLFVIDNLNIGGPQKSLLALTDNLDTELFDISILPMHNGGVLEPFFDGSIKILQPSPMLEAMTFPVDKPLRAILTFVKNGKIRLACNGFLSIIKHIVLKRNMNDERQIIWKRFHKEIPAIKEEYDAAFGILGLSTYCVVDLVNSEEKFHWIRSDTRILNRIESIDNDYYNRLSGVLSVSKICADIFEDMYPLWKDKVQVLYNYIPFSFYNGVECDTSMITHDIPAIVTVSRLVPLKGIELIIDVCSVLKYEKNLQFNWFIVGDGSHRGKYENLIKERKLEDCITILGFQLNPLGFIKEADIFALLSESEGKSNAIDEAIYVCKPIVVTNYPTVTEQIQDGVNGLICEFDSHIIAECIQRILLDEQMRSKLVYGCTEEKKRITSANEFFMNLLEATN